MPTASMKTLSSPSAQPRDPKPQSTSGKSETDWVRLAWDEVEGKPAAEHPETSLEHIVRGIVRRGLEPLPTKASISLRLDRDVLEWFKAQGPGPGGASAEAMPAPGRPDQFGSGRSSNIGLLSGPAR
jgi:uncharacterized protein (DUF4415 family)